MAWEAATEETAPPRGGPRRLLWTLGLLVLVFTSAVLVLGGRACVLGSASHVQWPPIYGEDEDWLGRHSGIWVFLEWNGRVMKEYRDPATGQSYPRSGFYDHGVKVRDLTYAEIEKARSELKQHRGER